MEFWPPSHLDRAARARGIHGGRLRASNGQGTLRNGLTPWTEVSLRIPQRKVEVPFPLQEGTRGIGLADTSRGRGHLVRVATMDNLSEAFSIRFLVV